MVEDGVGVVDGAQVGAADGALVGDPDGDLDGEGVGDGADPPSSWDQDFTEADASSGVLSLARGDHVGSGSTGAGGKGQARFCLT
jgi:hypothetical protein